MPKELYTFAHLPGGFVPAGILTLTETPQGVEASKFAYGTRYLDRPHAIEVDPVSLSLADKNLVRHKELVPINGLSLFGGLRDAAPGRSLRHDCARYLGDRFGRKKLSAHPPVRQVLGF